MTSRGCPWSWNGRADQRACTDRVLAFVLARRRTDGAGGFFGIERTSKWTTRIAVGGVVVPVMAM
jgi:hypothetical protein